MTLIEPTPRWGSFKATIIALRRADPTISYKEIVERVGCSYPYAKWVCSQHKIPLARPAAPIKARYFDLRKKHPEWSAYRIAKEMGVNSNSVYLLMKRCDPEYVSVFDIGKAARAAGLTIQKIQQLGVST